MKTFVALLLLAATAHAKSFLIERIDVNAAKYIPAAAVIAETRLKAGSTYDDDELQQALNRVRRLPFVLFASADLKPGSTPDARVLRINIEETANFNWGFDMSAVARSRSGSGSGATVGGNAGYRFFPNRHGTLDVMLGDTNESFLPDSATRRDATLAYNAYGLLGTSAYGNVAVGTIFRTNGRHDVNPSALLGLPLTRTQSIEAAFARTTSRNERSVSGIADPVRSSARITDASLAWLLQTADDPFFARHGFDVAAGPSWGRRELDLPFVLTFPKPPHVVPSQQSQRLFSLNASAAKFWPLRDASAFWSRVDATTTHIAGTSNGVAFPAARQNLGDLLFGAAHDFTRELGEEGQSRTRLEFGLGYHLDSINGRNASRRSGPEAEIGYAYRNRLGLAHITVSFVAH